MHTGAPDAVHDGVIEVDYTQWPMVLVRSWGRVSDEEHLRFLDALDARIHQDPRPYWLVMDLHESAGLSPKQRRRQADRIRAMGDERMVCGGVALVFDSAVLRGVMTAILWVSHPEYPVKVFASLEAASIWAAHCMQRSAA